MLISFVFGLATKLYAQTRFSRRKVTMTIDSSRHHRQNRVIFAVLDGWSVVVDL